MEFNFILVSDREKGKKNPKKPKKKPKVTEWEL